MKKITFLIAFSLFSFMASAQQGPFLYQVEANWLAECEAETPLTTEDFEGSPSGVAFCGPELSSTVSNNCFPAGELEDGFTITIENGANILYAPPGQLGSNQDVPTIGAEGDTGNFTIVTFTEAVTRVAFDIFGVSSTNGNGIIRVFDTNDTLLETFDITYIVSDFDFFGIHSSELIGRIELEDADDGDALFVSNLRFGTCRVNDDPDTATMLTVGDVFEDGSITSSNTFASDSQLVDQTIPAPGCANYNGADVWFSAIVPASGSITVETQFSENSALGDSGIALYTEDLIEVLDCDDDDGEGLFSLISLTDRTPGEIVLIRVWEFGGNGFGEFMVSAYDFSPPPNDLIENAIDVDEIGFPFTDSDINFPDATNDPINSDNCNGSTLNSVWYKFTTTETGIITASFEDPTNNDNKTIVFYTADNENVTLDDLLTFVNSGTNTCGFNLELSFEADANQTYYAFAQASTSVQTININFTPAPPNDLIENAIDVDELGFPYTDSDIDFPNATGDILTNTNGCDISSTFKSVWYKFTTTADGPVTASFTTNDTQSGVIFYTATDENATLDSLTVVDIDTCNFNEGVTFEAIGNQTYYAIVVSSEIGSIIIESDALLSAEENTIDGFSFFPNPVQNVLNVQANQSIDQVTLYNIAGQKVLDQNIGTTNSQLHVGNLTSGIYLMTVTSGENTSTYKVIKK